MCKACYSKDYRDKHLEHMRKLALDSYYNHLETRRKFQAISRREQIQSLKKEIFEILGNKCSNLLCAVPDGMKDLRALQIDHKLGNGHKQREKRDYLKYYKLILEDLKNGSSDYCLLCANCNQIKKIENKECTKRKY